MGRRLLSWIVSAGAIIGIGVHLLWPTIAIDAITVTLLLVALVPWLAPLFKAIELPGGVKVEFAELEKARREAESAGILGPSVLDRQKPSLPTLIHTDDPNLALAGLRIELERRLRKIASQHGVSTNQRGVGQLMRDLQTRKLLSPEQSSVLADLLPSLNAAVHGATVDPRASSWAAEVGPQLLAGLETPMAVNMESLLARWRVADAAGVAEVGEELSKAAIQSPREFLRVMSDSPEEFDRWLKELQYHTLTAYQSRNQLEDELYGAFYERLRQRLLDTMATYSRDPTYGPLAQRITEMVAGLKVRLIE